MIRTRVVVLAGAAALATQLCAPAASEARPRRRASFSTDKEFGLGVMIGAPSGLSGKYYMGGPVALAFGVGVFREFRHQEGTHVHLDVLWHPAVLATADSFVMPLYLGIGGRLLDHGDYIDNDVHYDNDTHVGVRAPIGLAMDFNNVPLDIFFELVLVADILVDSNHHDTLDFNGALGVRYYF